MSMKAVVLHGKEDLRIETVAIPTPGPGQVLIRNGYAGICGSDLHAIFAPEALGLSATEPHSVTGSTLPQILGHEFAGTIEAVGEGVDIEVGVRAAIYPTYACGECPACRKGRENACARIGFHGLSSDGGGMAEFTVVDAYRIHPLPDGVDVKMGALVEPMSVAWHATTRGEVTANSTALIVGAGPIGIGVYFALKAQGLTRVLVSEPSAERRALLTNLGAAVVDPVNEDLQARVAELTGGHGVDVAFDAAGAPVAFQSTLPLLAPAGRLVVVALYERTVDLQPSLLALGERDIVGTMAYLPEDFDAVIQAMASGVYDFTGWVETIGVDDIHSAVERLRSGAGAKILVSAEASRDTTTAAQENLATVG
ncbi:2,3-butanediol dehydrogenase [Demequina sp. B12]|uniref:2,3-butanediol dehydrogenase n=1 Tax=Demequina sp. B12 TaxID=2992757 RepID=UPI00237C1D73|nr:2,3-butanediol dehydrogenase [Demequina sp. B12]MDE0572073.1 2,3-butanediol dehydrogenase [Demequina sp. B12]